MNIVHRRDLRRKEGLSGGFPRRGKGAQFLARQVKKSAASQQVKELLAESGFAEGCIVARPEDVCVFGPAGLAVVQVSIDIVVPVEQEDQIGVHPRNEAMKINQ